MLKQRHNILKLMGKTKLWQKIELNQIIVKYLLKTTYTTTKTKNLLLLKKWTLQKKYFITRQTNVCKMSGSYKRTLNQIGLNRHCIRNLANTNKLIHLKKLSW